MAYKSRFAPSPTGFLHIGNARSAVLNWAYINNKGGEFILRIDDTDVKRSKPEFEEAIKEHLKWLGIEYVGFTGEIPDYIGDFNNLIGLILHHNQ